MAKLLNNQAFIWGVMSVIVFIVTQLLKWVCVKPYTSKITNEKTRRIVNTIIILLAFGVAVLIELAYSKLWLHTSLSLTRAFYGWSGSTSVYAFVERFLGKKVENPLKENGGQEVVDLVRKVVSDNTIDSKDKDAISEYLEKVK